MENNEAANFRGLLYDPIFEHEVVILFSLLIPHLEDRFAIDSYRDTFPDCFAKRNGQKVGIEFEVKASGFYEHLKKNKDELTKCDLLICWKNDIRWKETIRDGIHLKITTRDNIEFMKVNDHDIEIMALDKKVTELQKEKTLTFILHGKPPLEDRRKKEKFFEQVKEIKPARYEWIEQLYNDVEKRKEDFSVEWGGGERLSTMRFYVKKWDFDPISVMGDGSVYINYQENPAVSPRGFKLPQELQKELRQMFKHKTQKWPSVPLNTQTDFDNIKRVLDLIAEYSRQTKII